MSADDEMPDRLGPYRLLDRIGEGGMGVVYLARDADQRAVAVKVLKPGLAGEPSALQRLAREVETMRRVRSPFVAQVIGADLAGDLPYIVTRYVPGSTLDQVIADQGPLRGDRLARLARGLADALAAVHAAGVVHRDLKPGNVMMVGGSPVVIDFGIAQGPDATRLTMTGMFMGTPGYLSPEVIEGQPSSEASDVHAWGATVAFAATGRPPFGGGPYETIFYKIVNGQPDLAGAPTALLPLLAAALARDPAHRPPAVQLSALAAVLNPATLVPAPARPQLAGAAAAQATRADRAAGQHGGPAVPAGSSAAGVPAAVNGAAATVLPGAAAAAAAGGIAPGWAPPDGAVPDGAAAGWLAAGGAAAAGAAAAGPLDGAAAANATAAAAAARLAAAARAAGVRPADYADVLPPVAYQGRPAGGTHAPAVSPPGQEAASRPAATASPRGHSLLAAASMVVLVCVSVVLPVVGTATSLALIALLRAGEAARRGRALRRYARGARPSDALVSVVKFPWFLARSAAGMIFLSPLAAATGALAAGLTLIIVNTDRLTHAIAFAAGAVVAFYGLGPRSGRSRSQLSHLYAVVTRTRIAQAAALIAVVALVAVTATAAMSWPSLYWPVRSSVSVTHLGGAGYGGPLRLLPSGRVLLAHLRGR